MLTIGEVVTGDGYIETLDFPSGSVLPSGEAHVLLLLIGTVHDHLRRCLAMHGVVNLVLHGSKEPFRSGRGDILVDGGREVLADEAVEQSTEDILLEVPAIDRATHVVGNLPDLSLQGGMLLDTCQLELSKGGDFVRCMN